MARKRYLGVHGNHLEIQALSEMYNRPIHIYCYSAEPINIFQVSLNTSKQELEIIILKIDTYYTVLKIDFDYLSNFFCLLTAIILV